jgi:hypothetical protein
MHPDSQRIQGKHLTARSVTGDSHQRLAHNDHSAIGTPVPRGWYRQANQFRGGDLESASQRNGLCAAIQGTFPALDSVQVRLAHPGQPGNHPQGLTPRAADLAQPPTDRQRIIINAH